MYPTGTTKPITWIKKQEKYNHNLFGFANTYLALFLEGGILTSLVV